MPSTIRTLGWPAWVVVLVVVLLALLAGLFLVAA